MGDVESSDEADASVHHQDLLVVREGDVEGIGAAGRRVVQAHLDLPGRLVILHLVQRRAHLVLVGVGGRLHAVVEQYPHIHAALVDSVEQQLAQPRGVRVAARVHLGIKVHLPVGDEDELLRAADGIGHRLHGRAPVGERVDAVPVPHRRELTVRWCVVVAAGRAFLAIPADERGALDPAPCVGVCHDQISLRRAGLASMWDWNSYSARCR
ncbi:hypothetical protein [Stenotrophomonas maltophilia]|uniref:hypothetical protein n=1 Tax=Stenotrophomonas maltophilia TaxID=40324 RepID=UPI001E57F536|nr:hypothetical protein [Stenotrophomonas maltophilia]